MSLKRPAIVLLVALNALLVLILLSKGGWLPKALAQAPGRGGNYVTVTAKAQGQSYDVLYVLDVSDRKLHAFYPANVQTRELAYASFRDLKADFGRQ